ncbi:MAG: alpha/beta hydrolase [Porticoccaceae bacterium]|nr:MAG: alpha/beta hydrolase [Porticoccaceae bacterium]
MAKEERVWIAGPAGGIEASWGPPEGVDSAGGRLAAAVCHPHPLHGGTMDNKVVTTLARTFRRLGLPTVRFNFRGAGGSEGEHDGGVGEVEDLAAVVSWLAERTGAGRVLVAGFSFGSGVASNFAVSDPRALGVLLVAPPVGRYGFAPVAGYPCPAAILIGADDELVDVAQVRAWAETRRPPVPVTVLPATGHFFHGRLVDLARAAEEAVRPWLAEAAR